MGAMDWWGVVLAAIVGTVVLADALRQAGWRWLLAAVPLNLIAALMLGHALARIGPDKLAAKPQLFFMQSGGLALAFVIPALWLTQLRDGQPPRRTVVDSLAFLIAYLAMGAVFWARA